MFGVMFRLGWWDNNLQLQITSLYVIYEVDAASSRFDYDGNAVKFYVHRSD